MHFFHRKKLWFDVNLFRVKTFQGTYKKKNLPKKKSHDAIHVARKLIGEFL